MWVLPLLRGHGRLLQRHLVYTGISRARQLVVLVGELDALRRAIANTASSQRNTGLKKRLGGVPIVRHEASKPAFVELITPPATPPEECVVEFESFRGGKVRIQWKASAPPDWGSLLRAWREAEG